MATISAFPITIKQIADLTAASGVTGTDYLLAQQGATGTPYRKMTVSQIMGAGAAAVVSTVVASSSVTAARFIPSSSTVPTNGLYLPAANTLGWAINSTAEMQLTSTALSPTTTGGSALGTTSLMWAGLVSSAQILANMNATAAPANLVGTALRVALADSASGYIFGDAFGGAMYFGSRRSGGTNASPTALASGNIIGGIIARGYDGSAYSGQRASVVMRAEEAWTGSAHGTGVLISATLNGTTTEVDRLLIDGAGAFTFGPSGNTWKLTPSTTGGTAIAIAGGSTGGMTLATSGGVQFAVGHTASAVNYVSAKGGATGTGATVSALGSDSNINLILAPKGTGVLSVSAPVTVSDSTLTLTGTGTSTQTTGGVFLKTNNNANAVPVFRSQGRRNDNNASIAFCGQFVAEHVRTDAIPASGQTLGGLVFGGNVDLSETMTYTASITAETDGAWVDATNAPTALHFYTGIAGNNLAAPNITYGTRRLRIRSSGAVDFGPSGNTLTVTPNTTSGTAITLVGGGTGGMTFASSGGVQFAFTDTASAVNYLSVTGGASGNGATLAAVGASTDVNLILDAKGAGVISAADTINLASGKVLQVNSVQVVGPRDTGWTAMTGTTNKATAYDTSTVTLAQLAGRVMALQAALTTHGIIGT